MAVFLPVGILVLFAVVGTFLLAETLSEQRARRSLSAVVSQSSAVSVNGQLVSDSATVFSALRRLTHVPAHHSSPTTPIHLELAYGHRVVAVTIARDSENPIEFWVYRPGPNWHNDPLGQDAGRIVSRELGDYLKRSGL
jgi:hypothetical protein